MPAADHTLHELINAASGRATSNGQKQQRWKDGPCQWEGCDEPSIQLATGRRSYTSNMPYPLVKGYCDEHAGLVADQEGPEYQADCPNCGCRFGVN